MLPLIPPSVPFPTPFMRDLEAVQRKKGEGQVNDEQIRGTGYENKCYIIKEQRQDLYPLIPVSSLPLPPTPPFIPLTFYSTHDSDRPESTNKYIKQHVYSRGPEPDGGDVIN